MTASSYWAFIVLCRKSHFHMQFFFSVQDKEKRKNDSHRSSVTWSLAFRGPFSTEGHSFAYAASLVVWASGHHAPHIPIKEKHEPSA